MESLFSDRIADVPRSFIREILKVSLDHSVISFAGGLPNRELFPAEELKQATVKVFEMFGRDLFQYSNSEGFIGLRELTPFVYSRDTESFVRPFDSLLRGRITKQGTFSG